ncbi:ATP-binding protein [Candidatus Woesearchaeota archaeon]|nr:MAG: ATP-binding protein [Candidatus Woesearchaeota archaeon]
MCSITGYFNIKDAEVKVVDTLKLFHNRGKDSVGIATPIVKIAKTIEELDITNSKNAIGHTLHAMVNLIPQPIKNEGLIVSNCEIYNWKELCESENIDARNDSELLLKLLDKYDETIEVLNKLDGVYAFAYWKDDKIILARDLIGVKPLWYSTDDGFAFASEKKALQKQEYSLISELNPRTVLKYDIKTDEIELLRRDFFNNKPEHEKSHEEIKKEVQGLFLSAVSKRIPDEKVGLLFSGGIDSTIIAKTLQSLNVDFVCYTAAMTGKGLATSEDLTYSRRIAKEYGFELKEVLIDIDDVEEKIRKVVPLIEDTNVVKVGVGLTFLSVCEQAQIDGIRVMYSGLGSEDIFAGYERHKNSLLINDECSSGLLKMYERDLYRDDVITMNHNIELRLPFLDKKLVDYSLKIPAEYKLDDVQNKKIIREVAEDLGLDKEFSQRKKRAAQYGSRFDSALNKLAKRNGYSKKSEYLSQFLDEKNLKLGLLLSGGKDSNYAGLLMQRQNYELACAITIMSKNDYSYMFHTPAIELTKLQAESMGLPLVIAETSGEKEKELEDLKIALKEAKVNHRIEGVITGAVFSNYQRERIENVCDELDLKIFSPLWHMNQRTLMEQLIAEGYEFIFTAVQAYGFDKSWLGRTITYEDIEKLSELEKKYKINVAGEGGEFESLVLNGPNYSKPIEIVEQEIEVVDENTARLIIKKAK